MLSFARWRQVGYHTSSGKQQHKSPPGYPGGVYVRMDAGCVFSRRKFQL